jgi:hypothetical protein
LIPSRQLGHIRFTPKACLALALDAPRKSVMNTTASPMTKRAIQAGILRGSLANDDSMKLDHCLDVSILKLKSLPHRFENTAVNLI